MANKHLTPFFLFLPPNFNDNAPCLSAVLSSSGGSSSSALLSPSATSSSTVAAAAGGAPSGGKRVAVVGSGISGLSAAYLLARAGHGVVLYEREATAGGHTLTDDSAGVPADLGFQVRACPRVASGCGGETRAARSSGQARVKGVGLGQAALPRGRNARCTPLARVRASSSESALQP